MGRGRQLSAAALAVEEAHDALDNGDVGPAGAVGEERADEIRAREESIEVAARSSRGECVVGGVYKVGADLEGGDAQTPVRERGHQARGDGGFADTRVCARDDYARGSYGNRYHSMPFWPR